MQTHACANTHIHKDKITSFSILKIMQSPKTCHQIYTLVMNSCPMAPPPSTSGPAFLYHECTCTMDWLLTYLYMLRAFLKMITVRGPLCYLPLFSRACHQPV